MRKTVFFFTLCLACGLHAVERVSLDSLQANWSKYINQNIELTTPLVVSGSFYDSLILAPTRLFCPEEIATGLADGDSTAYFAHVAQNRETSIVVHCRNNYYNVRTGDIVRRFKARVTSERHLVTGQPIKTRHMPMDRLPRPKKGELRIVGANIENYFADLGGYATKRTTPAQQAVKTRKLVKAMRKMHADILALCEMQVGDRGPQMLLEPLNKGGAHYAFIAMPLPNADRIGGCFLYNKDRVRAYGTPLSAYQDTASHYHGRMFAQGFEELSTGEKFIISLSHLKSKRPGRGNYDTHLKRLQNTDSLLAMLPQAMTHFGDSDLLLLGDFNCYTQELPIVRVIRSGYADLLPHGTPSDYSYSFRGEAGYLDRCFANPSMSAQIIRVRPWHVNADWYYSHGAYKQKDRSEHRYSDHDPIIVDIQLR